MDEKQLARVITLATELKAPLRRFLATDRDILDRQRDQARSGSINNGEMRRLAHLRNTSAVQIDRIVKRYVGDLDA